MKKRVGISKLTVKVPPERETVGQVISKIGADPADAKFLERIHELKTVPRLNDDSSLANLLSETTAALLQHEDAASIDFVLYAHSILAQTPYHATLLPDVLNRVGLGGVPYWGVSQLNCASGLSGADMAARLLKSRASVKRVLLLTGDATPQIPEARYITKSTVMGDSASAAIIEPQSRYEFLSFSWLRDNRFAEGFYATLDDQSKFGEIYQAHLLEVARNACDKAGLALDAIDWIVPHNVNMTTWRRFCRNSGFPKERVFTALLGDLGHSYCNDCFLNLNEMESRGMIESGQTLLMVSVGVGSYFGASVMRRHKEQS